MTRHARGWKKAMGNVLVWTQVETTCSKGGFGCEQVITDCSQEDGRGAVDEGLASSHGGELSEGGWTYDREGNWTCPECNKEGGEA